MLKSENGVKAEQIIDEYYHDIYKFCCARCRNADDAKDITQETFAMMVEQFDELYFDNIDSWLFSVANKKLHEYFRRIKKEKGYVSIYDVDVPVIDVTDVENYVQAYDLFDDTQKKILNILNEKERELFTKLYVEKKSVSLIAQEYDITENALRKRKSRLKKKITDAVSHTSFLMAVVAFKIFH
ncbi:MAG: sigma-70 family RNA polymerase sigma factor [Clostridia bacterium]|nr:sigma-70 family RNA polymerase sigma factor [Clostridia bacterium]